MDPAKLRIAKDKVHNNTFALTVLLQKRCQELVTGAKPLIDKPHKSPIETALDEIVEGKIWLGSLEQVMKEKSAAAAAATAAS
jgi:DNA-directed RNA polymerase subunit K/omega